MDIASRFAAALDAGSGDPDLLPMQLVRAAATVLPADSAGLSVHAGPIRTPLAASSEPASTAERLQFTAGQGPCLLAAETDAPVYASAEALAHRWPVFHELLVDKTPIRSVLALPLTGPLKGLAVLDLFFTDPHGPGSTRMFEAGTVAHLMSEQLERTADWSMATETDIPAWANTPDARRRGGLWIAVGMLTLELGLPAPDALALLRGSAYATDRTVDNLAADVVNRRIHPAQFREGLGGDR